jgi:hypothetical protein
VKLIFSAFSSPKGSRMRYSTSVRSLGYTLFPSRDFIYVSASLPPLSTVSQCRSHAGISSVSAGVGLLMEAFFVRDRSYLRFFTPCWASASSSCSSCSTSGRYSRRSRDFTRYACGRNRSRCTSSLLMASLSITTGIRASAGVVRTALSTCQPPTLGRVSYLLT